MAAVIKAGAAREHEMLAEIQGAVLSFIRRMEPRRVMDTMLVSRVRILYIRSLLSRSPELQNLKVIQGTISACLLLKCADATFMLMLSLFIYIYITY